MADLIFTNGDSAGDLLAAAGKTGLILPWRDVLHEGPIAFDLEACTNARVDYLARRFRYPMEDITTEFAARDGVLRDHEKYDRIELWFEHDLYDQLQLLQILAFLADVGRKDGVTLVQADDFLGAQRADTILRFGSGARPVDDDDLDLAEVVWADLAMPTPERSFARLAEPDPRFPFLGAALRRMFDELPAPSNGISRTETTALDEIARGTTRATGLFSSTLASEEAAFMGDLSFFAILDDLAFAATPLIAGLPAPAGDNDESRFRDAALALTATGDAVLAGEADHVEINGLDRWWAGTRLQGHSVWRYDRAAMELVAPDEAEA